MRLRPVDHRVHHPRVDHYAVAAGRGCLTCACSDAAEWYATPLLPHAGKKGRPRCASCLGVGGREGKGREDGTMR